MDLNSSENEISIKKSSTSSNKPKLIKLSYNENKIFVPRDQLLSVPKSEDEEYLAGDLVWVKAKGFPWWPCMITVDPETGNYSKNVIIRNKEIKKFHVQYFGSKACRGYTEGNVMNYEGKAKYDLKLDSIKNTPTPNKGQRKIELSNFNIKPSFKKDWNIAGDEADIAMNLSREMRLRNLTFEYVLDKPLKTIPKRQSQDFNQEKSQSTPLQTPKSKKRKNENQTSTQKRKREKISQSSIKSSPADVYDFNEFEDDFIDDTPTKFELSSAKRAKGEFSVYVQKVRDDIVKENPELTDQEIDEKLKHNWEIMSDDMRNVYAPRTSLFLNSSFQSESPKKETDISLNLSNNSFSRNSFSDLNFDSTIADVSSNDKKRTKKSKNDSVLDINKENSIKSSKRKSIKLEHNKSSPKKNIEENKKTKATSVKPNNIKSDVDIAQFLSSEGNVASEDSVSCSSENDVSDQKETENNIERYCGKCYQNDKDLIRCDGQCSQYYHKECLSNSCKNDSIKKCEECFTGEFKCFICKEHTDDVSLCSEKKCGKFYHLKCLSLNYPHKIINIDQKKFKCPLHFCLTCHNEHLEDSIVRTVKKKLTTCLKCPTAYHVLDACIAAGSISIDSNHIICPEHHDKKSMKHVNVSWCFSCNFGGNLICCEKCPTAFHQECLLEEGGKLPDEGSYFCNDCIARKQLHYGDIVWVKLSNFRWWPAKLKHPTNVPDNILNIKHNDGDFPVFFYGSHDYFWINRSKAFLYMEGDDKRKISNAANRSLDKIFKKAMEEVVEEYETWQESKKTVMQLKTNIPPPYYHLKINKPYGKCQQAFVDLDKSHNQACECTDTDPCGSDDCLNRVLMYECDTVICKNKEKCKNQRFKKREYAKTEPFKTQAGWGLKTSEDIKKGQFVIEYVGELVDEEECNKRLNDMALRNDKNFYFLTIDKETIIDAGPKGNLARFMNHSCDPNCETQKWVVNNQVRVGLFAKTDIPAGSELTFNYNLESRGNEKTKCLCNSKNCSGYIGIRPNKIVEDKQKQKDVKKKKNKPDYASIHEDECFRCGEVGKLIMCDQKNCPKSYHLSCLKLEKIPHGKWNCPWHHCDECGKKSIMFCNYCPTSYCSEHEKVELTKLQNGDLICTDHNSAYLQKVKKLANKNTENNPVSITDEEQSDNSQVNKTAKRNRRSIADQKEEVAEKRKRDEERRRKNIESRANRMSRRNSNGNQIDNSTCILNNDKQILNNNIKDENFEKSLQSTQIIEEENNLSGSDKEDVDSTLTHKSLDSKNSKIIETEPEIKDDKQENEISQSSSESLETNIEKNEKILDSTSNNINSEQLNSTDIDSVETLKDNLDQEKAKKLINNDENKNDNLKQQINLN